MITWGLCLIGILSVLALAIWMIYEKLKEIDDE